MNFLRAFTFWFWIFEVTYGIITIITGASISPVLFTLVAATGLIGCIDIAINKG